MLSNAPIDLDSPCADTTLYKAEIWSNKNCYRAVKVGRGRGRSP